MAEKLKDHYNEAFAKDLAARIKGVYADFDGKKFVSYITEHLGDREFLARQDVFADAFELTLPRNYAETVTVFEQLLGPELGQETGMFTEGWWLWPVGRYVERHGTDDVKKSLDFIKELTKRFTGEFAIRPLIAEKPKETIKIILKWSKDPNVHVRRLSSECMRIRLPWAKKLYTSVEEFESYKTILSNLKSDPSGFVRKSVGNNLNDLYKEYPEKAEEIVEEWLSDNPSKETLWIINHGKRSLKK
ncbi:DNA alkylation repair protein [Brucepastera parasyntrophica]|uniref:DNA alkylation repair protein n=1 Tax=Brucepastera parasyntrophica TaxID=2880008 RepID=UPI0021097FAE|nr:DNA alkylation repair protein [Brucepastera parasyntrophica]ULQ60631.1 DNA alkylation repair protein [Brucepastera parasyntrophica]